MSRYNRVVGLSFMGAILLMAVTAAAGFATFGSASDSLILNNYAVTDTLMSVSRFAVALSLLFSYPLAFVGVREGFLDLLGEKMLGVTTVEQRQAISDPLSIALLALITGMAFVVKDIRIILALGGATWGNCVIYLFPSLMMIKTILSSSSSSSRRSSSSNNSSKSIILPAATGIVGLCLGVVGTVKALQTLV